MVETTSSGGNTAPIYPVYWGRILVRIISAWSDEEAQRKADSLWRTWTGKQLNPHPDSQPTARTIT